jgi:4-alpha-glucanotransferase
VSPPSQSIFEDRRAGVLLHPSSLPGAGGHGSLGAHAFRFIDFLATTAQTVWQILPLGPTHDDGSPYQALSVNAGNPRLIDLESLAAEGWIGAKDTLPAKRGNANHWHARGLRRAREGFAAHAGEADKAALANFIRDQRTWLEDYALFLALKHEHGGVEWSRWPTALRDREQGALADAERRHADIIAQVYFEQFIFFRQWHRVRAYANERGILLFGDMPIFVSYDSVDVWVHRPLFDLDELGRPRVVAGVPPDYFSSTGQRWGNPHYRWDVMAADGFKWWRDRVAMQMQLVDIVRIDHFRGFEAFWEIPAHEETAIRGHWVKGPGEALFDTLLAHYPRLPFVAEDLGIITAEVNALREKYRLPGMKILQFAFDGGSDNPYLPHNHSPLSVVYTGTHDNTTTLGWYDTLPEDQRKTMHDYLGTCTEPMPWPLIRTALTSVARLAIVPMQDVLGLGAEHRMNTPGTSAGNWRWQFSWEQLLEDVPARLLRLTQLCGRARR